MFTMSSLKLSVHLAYISPYSHDARTNQRVTDYVNVHAEPGKLQMGSVSNIPVRCSMNHHNILEVFEICCGEVGK